MLKGRAFGHAAAFGALWGASELTLGTALHLVRLPFSGFILAAAGAFVLGAALARSDERGLCLAAGLVALAARLALGGAFVFTAALSILAEAALAEAAFALPLSGRKRAFLAGAGMGLWVLLYLLLFQRLLYGPRIIEAYLSILGQAAAAVGAPEAWGLTLLALLPLPAALAGRLGYGLAHPSPAPALELPEAVR